MLSSDWLKVVRETWGGLVTNIGYISDKVDTEHGTMVLPFTVNTDSGHCNKTLAILEHFANTMEDGKQFLVIADDDTILSVTRLLQLISCYTDDNIFMLGWLK